MGTSLEKAAATWVSVSIPTPDAEAERILRAAFNFSTRSLDGTLLMQNVPSNEEHRLLSARREMLARSMRFDRYAVKTLVEQMLICFPKPIKENEIKDEVVALFIHELSLDPIIPTWAISQAVGNIRLGQCPEVPLWTNPRPATFAVRRAAERFAWSAKAEIVCIDNVLKGERALPEISPEERSKLGKKFRAFADSLLARQRARVAREEQDDAERLRQMIGADAFSRLPDAPKRRGSALGKEAAKIAAGGRR